MTSRLAVLAGIYPRAREGKFISGGGRGTDREPGGVNSTQREPERPVKLPYDAGIPALRRAPNIANQSEPFCSIALRRVMERKSGMVIGPSLMPLEPEMT
jgi:hypothetical protein